jgi:ribonuclease P protein component
MSADQRLTLRKGEKLRHRSLIEPLFKEGETIYEFPLRLTWRALDDAELKQSFRNEVPERIDSLQMLITVPKKKRRHAVDRVLMRRRIREAYRLNRLPLKADVEAESDIATLGMAIIYLADKNLPYSTIEQKIKLLLKRVGSRLAKRHREADSPQQQQ